MVSFPGAIPRYGSFYGQGPAPIFLGGLECTGLEMNILNCTRDSFGGEYCRSYENAGVKCQGNNLLIVMG